MAHMVRVFTWVFQSSSLPVFQSSSLPVFQSFLRPSPLPQRRLNDALCSIPRSSMLNPQRQIWSATGAIWGDRS